jgi:hypothetical protein
MKGRWESNKNVWFPFMYYQKWNCEASLFPRQNYNVLSPKPYTHIPVRDYIFPGLFCLFCCSQICGPIPGIHDIWCGNWDCGRAIPRKGIHKWDFRCSVSCTRLDRGRWAWWQTRWRARSRTRRRWSSAPSWAGPATRRRDETQQTGGGANTTHNQTSDVTLWGWSLCIPWRFMF